MKKVYDLKITLHPPKQCSPRYRDLSRWHLWADDQYHVAEYHELTPVRRISSMVRKSLEGAFNS